MATPKIITVTGKFMNGDTPDSGKVSFQMPGFLRSSVDNEIKSPLTFSAVLVDGVLTLPVYSTTDPDWTPQGWTYKVTLNLSEVRSVFDITVPFDSFEDTLDLADILPSPPSGGQSYAPLAHTHPELGGGGGGGTPSDSVASQTSYGLTASPGDATSYSRGNHRHGTPGLPTPAAIGAAASSHTHISSQVTDLTEAVQDIVGAFIVPGTNITKTYDDAANTLTIDAAGGGGGGGGITPSFARGYLTTGDLPVTAHGTWTLVPGTPVMSIPAVAGDNVEFFLGALFDMNASLGDFFEGVLVVGGVIKRFASTGSATPAGANEGDPSIYPVAGGRFRGSTVFLGLQVSAGDLDNGNAVFSIAHLGSGGGKVFASTDRPMRWRIRNDKQ